VNDDAGKPVDRLWNVTRQALVSLVVVGLVLAFFAALAGFVVVAAALGALVVAQITIALVHYRRTMRRAWPAVPPSPDDEDDW
jgi:membrane associated rhomboid family serine protease